MHEQLNRPIIIWTNLRTGSTQLAHALFNQFKEYKQLKDNPFKVDEKYGHIHSTYLETKDKSELRASLEKVCSTGALIKHAVEECPDEFNLVLANVTSYFNYQHIFLYRRINADRMISLYFAMKTDIYFKPDLIINISDWSTRCQSDTRQLALVNHHLTQKKTESIHVAFEDLFNKSIPIARKHQSLLANSFHFTKTQKRSFFERLADRSPSPKSNYSTIPNYDEVCKHFSLEKTFESSWFFGEQIRQVYKTDYDLLTDSSSSYMDLESKITLKGVLQSQRPLPNTQYLIREYENGFRQLVHHYLPKSSKKDRDTRISGKTKIYSFGVTNYHTPQESHSFYIEDSESSATRHHLSSIHFSCPYLKPLVGINIENKVGFVDIPKIASTSLKHLFYELVFSKRFNPNNDFPHIHKFWEEKIRDISQCEFRFALLRDPIKRFISAYDNRVLHHNDLSRNSTRQIYDISPKFKPFPTLSEFIQDFDVYRLALIIEHHTRPISNYFQDLSQIDKLYKIEAISELESDLSSYLKKEVSLPKEQLTSTRTNIGALSKHHLDYLLSYYAEDYELFKDYYHRDTIIAEWKSSKH